METPVATFCLAGVILLSLGAASCTNGAHEKDLDLEFSNRYVVPSFARTREGQPYTGAAYGTFFGEQTFDCVEWEGAFEGGRPHGKFNVYANCNILDFRVYFNHGVRVDQST